MNLHIDYPGTEMDKKVRAYAQEVANKLARTQYIVMERRTWERVMPTTEDKPYEGR